MKISRITVLLYTTLQINPSRPDVNGTNHIQCRDHIGSLYILMDMLLIFAYLYGVYIFRVKEPEHLSSFAETVRGRERGGGRERGERGGREEQ